MMDVAPLFREDDPAVLQALMRRAGLGQFVTATADGPIATPLPMVFDPEDGPSGAIYGHLSRRNPQWSTPMIGDGLAIFMGLDAYISPSWYKSKQVHGEVVPTWNYEAVQAFGPVSFFTDSERLLQVVTMVTDRHEAHRPDRWRVSDAPSKYIQAELEAIVGFRMPIARLIGKRKMSQNRSLDDRAGVAAGLATSDRPMDQQVADLIRTHGPGCPAASGDAEK